MNNALSEDLWHMFGNISLQPAIGNRLRACLEVDSRPGDGDGRREIPRVSEHCNAHFR